MDQRTKTSGYANICHGRVAIHYITLLLTRSIHQASTMIGQLQASQGHGPTAKKMEYVQLVTDITSKAKQINDQVFTSIPPTTLAKPRDVKELLTRKPTIG